MDFENFLCTVDQVNVCFPDRKVSGGNESIASRKVGFIWKLLASGLNFFCTLCMLLFLFLLLIFLISFRINKISIYLSLSKMVPRGV